MKKQELTITPALIQKYAAFLREQERAASTVVKYVHELTVLEILLAGRPVTKGALLEWKEDLIGQYTPASVNNKLAAVNGFCGMGALRLRKLKIQKALFLSEEKELTRAEYVRLVRAAEQAENERLSLVIQTICATGIRVSELNKKAYVHIEDWRNRPLQGGRYPYVYVDGIYLRRNWGGEFENVAILVAIAVNEDGYREVLGAAEGMKEDKASWVSFFQWLLGRGLDGVKLIVGDKCMGMLEAVGEVFPDAKYQRCTVHFYRNVFSVVPKSKVKIVAKMLKAIHAQESKKASREKAKAVVAELRAMKLKEAAKKVEDGIEETLTYCDFPGEHWTRIRTNNVIERLNREIRRRTRVVGTFPDGNSALMLVCARLRHVAGTQWGNKKYMNMKHLEAAIEDVSIAG